MLNAAFFYFLQSIGFLLREVWLNNMPLHSEIITLTTDAARWNFGGPSRAPQHPWQRGGAGSERRRRVNPPCTTVLVCSHHGENHLFHLEGGLVPHALPLHPGFVPSCRVSMSSEGMNPVLKILWFYLDKKKNLACLHWHIKIALVWVNLQSFLLVKISSLSFFLTYHINLFIECPSFLLLYQDICRRLPLVLFVSPEIICRAFETSSCCIVVMQCAAVAWTYHILMWMSC